MLDKIGLLTFIADCDLCSYSEDTGEEDFYQAVDFIKESGWRITKEGDEWIHICPSCHEGSSHD